MKKVLDNTVNNKDCIKFNNFSAVKTLTQTFEIHLISVCIKVNTCLSLTIQTINSTNCIEILIQVQRRFFSSSRKKVEIIHVAFYPLYFYTVFGDLILKDFNFETFLPQVKREKKNPQKSYIKLYRPDLTANLFPSESVHSKINSTGAFNLGLANRM